MRRKQFEVAFTRSDPEADPYFFIRIRGSGSASKLNGSQTLIGSVQIYKRISLAHRGLDQNIFETNWSHNLCASDGQSLENTIPGYLQ